MLLCSLATRSSIEKFVLEEEMAEKGSMTVKEAGRKGGRATKARHGPEFYKAIGRKGGETTKERHGPQFDERIGRKGGLRVRALVAQAKKAQKR